MAVTHLKKGTVRDEVYSRVDKNEMSRVVQDRLAQYNEQIARAEEAVHDAERRVVRARHELHRLEHHRGAIYDFCDKQGINREDNV